MLKPCNGSSTRALDDTPTDCTRQQNFLTDLLSRVLYFERERDGLFWLFEICNFRKRREKTVPFFTSSFLAWTSSFHGLLIYNFLLLTGNINLIFEASTLAIATINL
ncbi:hypothetical protein OIU76_014948 [Salix suchowensis]|nr:hypothetical protein OIU76_014948 [Salix suchowensis]